MWCPSDVRPRLLHHIHYHCQLQRCAAVLPGCWALLVDGVVEGLGIRDAALLLATDQLALLGQHHHERAHTRPPVAGSNISSNQVSVEDLMPLQLSQALRQCHRRTGHGAGNSPLQFRGPPGQHAHGDLLVVGGQQVGGHHHPRSLNWIFWKTFHSSSSHFSINAPSAADSNEGHLRGVEGTDPQALACGTPQVPIHLVQVDAIVDGGIVQPAGPLDNIETVPAASGRVW